jgi:hypothetical protein
MHLNKISLTLALDVLRQQAALAQEQYDWLHLQQGYAHFLKLNERQLEELLQKMRRDCRAGRYSPLLSVYFEATIEARITFLRSRN